MSSNCHRLKGFRGSPANPDARSSKSDSEIQAGGRPMIRTTRSNGIVTAAVMAALAILMAGCGSATDTRPAGSEPIHLPVSSRPPATSTVRPSSPPSATPRPAGTLDNPIDLASLALETRTIRPSAIIETKVGPYSVIQTGGWLWVGSPDGLVRIDPEAKTAAFVDHDHGAKVVARGVNVWRAAYLDDRVTRYDGRTGKILGRVTLPAPLGMSVSGPLWVSLHNSGEIVQVNESTGAEIRRVMVATEGASGAGEVMPIGSDVWVVSTDDRSVVQVDARSGRLGRRIEFPDPVCEQAAFTATAIWVCLAVGEDEPPLVQRLDVASGALGPVYRFESSPASAISVGATTWLPTARGMLGVDAATGVPARFLAIDAGDVVPRYAIKAFGSIWVVCRDGQVLQFTLSDFA
jgi:hypothetical protein